MRSRGPTFLAVSLCGSLAVGSAAAQPGPPPEPATYVQLALGPGLLHDDDNLRGPWYRFESGIPMRSPLTFVGGFSGIDARDGDLQHATTQTVFLGVAASPRRTNAPRLLPGLSGTFARLTLHLQRTTFEDALTDRSMLHVGAAAGVGWYFARGHDWDLGIELGGSANAFKLRGTGSRPYGAHFLVVWQLYLPWSRD